MAVGNIPKFHAFVGIAAAAVAMPVACSSADFEGCKASRTCPSNDAGEAGGGADTGGTTGRGGSTGEAGSGDTGGSSGAGAGSGSGGTSGAAGSGDGGDGGDGGSSDDTVRPTVLSFSPDDGDADVERDVTVTAELSEPIDEATVTTDSVTLSGPDGEVDGTVTLAENVISFVPDRHLSLLATYTFMLSDTIADLSGNTLARNAGVDFAVREGAFGSKIHPFGTTEGRYVRAFDRNRFGDFALGTVFATGDRVDGAVFDSASNSWTAALQIIHGSMHSIAIDPEQRVAAAVSSSSGFGWSRLVNNQWTDAGDLGAYPNIVASPSGIVTSVSRDASNEDWSSHTLNLSNGIATSPLRLPLPSDRTTDPLPVASLEDVAVLGVRSGMNYSQELYVLWNRGSGWTAPDTLANSESSGIGVFRFASDELGNIIVAWIDAGGLHARIYERENGSWTDPELLSPAQSLDLLWTPAISAGRAVVAASSATGTSVHLYQPGSGWVAANAVAISGAVNGLGVAIDSSGNALVVWNAELNFRRYVTGSGWQAASDLDANVDATQMWMRSAPDGTAMVVASDLNSNNAILAVRFQ